MDQPIFKGYYMNKVGLLPLYLELYDDACAFMRPRIQKFLETITQMLRDRDINLICSQVCRKKEEFDNAIKEFENANVSAIITLHLAYSPSLECIEALARTKLPVAVLDSTESYAFDASSSPEDILYNHGIHGVQDMCNLLKRFKKPYKIFAGHYLHSDVLDRVVAFCRGSAMAEAFTRSRIGIIGVPFKGMGDFYVPFADLNKRFGIEVIQYNFDAGKARIDAITNEKILQEKKIDVEIFNWDFSITDKLYELTTKVCLAIRSWVEEEKLSAYSINFLATENNNPGLPIMPFIECSKSMGNGIGYAGEGDVITAALCGAILKIIPHSTFAEMFCPDWKGNTIFLSHMGEFNYAVCSEKPLLKEMDFIYASAENTLVGYGTFKSGQVVIANIAPNFGGEYILILTTGEMLDIRVENELRNTVHGWFKPHRPLNEFLEQFSIAGGTHHSVLIYGECINELKAFAFVIGIECIVI